MTKLSKNEVLMLNIGSMCTGARVLAVRCLLSHCVPSLKPQQLIPVRGFGLINCQHQQAYIVLAMRRRLDGVLGPSLGLCFVGEERSGKAAADVASVHERGREDRAQPKSGKALATHRLGRNTEWPQDGLAFTKLICST